jgi:uncharacterized protein YkwD
MSGGHGARIISDKVLVDSIISHIILNGYRQIMYKKVSIAIIMASAIAAILIVPWSALQRSHAQTDLSSIILDIHNRERADVKVPALVWSDELASDAKSWADHLATTGALEHATGTGQGENLAQGAAGFHSTEQLVQGWVDEKKNWHSGTVLDKTNWYPTGHYTQMVWKTTTHIGCADATGGGKVYLVCRYSPPGNYMGQSPY